MSTLYDVIGVSPQASQEQIEHVYRFAIDAITSQENTASVEENAIRFKALKEAYSILSSAKRRQQYDQSLRAKPLVTYEVVEKRPFPWLITLCVTTLLACGYMYYDYQRGKVERAQQELAVKEAQIKAEAAEQEALLEKEKTDRERLRVQRQQELRESAWVEQSRREGQYISERNRRFEEQAERARERDEQQAERNRQREERDAQLRAAADAAAMRRALSAPPSRPVYPGKTPGGAL